MHNLEKNKHENQFNYISLKLLENVMNESLFRKV